MTMTWNRILSGAVAIIYMLVAAFTVGAEGAFKVGMFVVLPLACIWFSEAMGGYVGPTGSGAITGASPAVLVCILGWVVLLLPVILAGVSACSR